ncbi:transcription elongation factor GreA [Clostridium formicaceticum]|uniref:Transcription elongation factor GreA n=1 Tax=Clostridium formicaceticum TaxID=1497 RepID=A0AAC9RP59_9CLOT|nr:transcription elongation factor GreA [Clostridium formicaceticum]AOY75151.1 transcription elongation factor GreA [Clostridium formicaceticum]ARE89576.1 Transcription elongation factor GreA [Clostridium formicaceticum]
MVDKEVVLTLKGLKKIEDEIEHLKTVRRKEVAERIKQAIAFGDISENSEYDEAKNEQAQVEERIMKLESMLKKARVIDEDDISLDQVSIGTTVQVKDIEFDEIVEYTIVGSAEADPYELKISNESPVGRALLGKKIGAIVEVQIPDGVTKYEVLKIEKGEIDG